MTDLHRLTTALADRYRIERELGSGGMATVYLAQDVKHHRPVAVKVLRPELAAALGPERFLREIEIAARLTHPHILPLYDSGEANGFLYYVMPYVEGETLRDRLEREKQLPLDDALQLAREVADALSYAHSHDVIHRDIKPENILLESGHAVVADFGIARAITAAGGERLTETGIAVGTPSYMSPEQAAGSRDLDGRSDLYSLGCVLYEMLAGQPPFTGPTAESVIHQHLTVDPKSVTYLRTAVPSAVAEALQKVLAKTPADRFTAAQQLAEALRLVPTAGQREGAATSIAVLPFANMSADPENEYFSDGITEEIINALTKVEALQVAARTSAFAFKGKNVHVRTIGQQLNVGTILEGSVRKAGNMVRVSAQLIDVANGFHLWSDRFDREMKDIFAIQDEISGAIVNTLTAKLVKDEPKAPARRSTVDLEAYNLYLKGRYHWNHRTNAAMLRAIEYFEQALDRDPDYAPAHAGIADCYTLLGWVAFGALPPREAFPKAEAEALKAIEIDESLAEAHNSLGWTRLVYNWDWDAADQAFTRAIALNPRYAMAHSWYGVHLAWMGKTDEAIAEATEAELLDPLSLIIHTLAGWVFYFARRYEESVEHYRKTFELDPNYVRAHLGLGWAYEQMGMLDEAVAEFERGVQLSGGSPRYLGALGHAYAIAGKRREALQQIEELIELSHHQYVSPSYVAAVYVGLGDKDQTFDWLERAFQERSGALVFLRIDPQMERLQSDPRFDELVKRVGF